MKKSEIFHSPTKGQMKLIKVIEEISDFINQSSQDKYEIVVGTDSNGNQKGKTGTDFITAIIAYRIGKGGRFFWKKTNGHRVFSTLRDRIYEEVTISLKTAEDLLGYLEKTLKLKDFPDYDLQIHIDVGHNGDTRDMIKEVVGMVSGNGFKAKIKPESYGASSVADRYV
jgi:uncharacterized protein